jgi:ABC-type branched-subunit amino acid transport system ATPase component
MTQALVIRGLSKRFGGLRAVQDVSFTVQENETVALIGPNGAGKTTTFNCITGLLPLTAGRVELDGRDISRLPSAGRAALGMARTFQQVQLFGHLSVQENLLLGRHRHYGSSPWMSAVGLGRRAEQRAKDDVAAVADRCGLGPVLGAPVGELPYGTQRMVEVARALATEPSLLLLDEPGAGMDSGESDYFTTLLAAIARERALSVLIIEHDVAMVLALSQRVYVLDFGHLLMTGTPAEVRADTRVRIAYLGSSVDV